MEDCCFNFIIIISVTIITLSSQLGLTNKQAHTYTTHQISIHLIAPSSYVILLDTHLYKYTKKILSFFSINLFPVNSSLVIVGISNQVHLLHYHHQTIENY